MLLHVFKQYLARVVVAASNDTFLYPVTPGGTGEATVATEAASVTARYEILGREVSVHFTFRVDANTVRHGLDSSKSLIKK